MIITVLLLCCIIVVSSAFSIVSPAELQNETFTWTLATFSAHLGSPGVVAPLVIVPSPDNLGCSALNSSLVSGKVVLLDRGGCAFLSKTQNVIAAGGLGCLLANNQDGGVTPSGSGTVSIPTLGVSLLDGQKLRNYTAQYGQVIVAFVQNATRPDQKQALVDLYLNCGGANWSTDGTVNNPPLGWANWRTTDPCQEPWQGLNCNPDGTIRQVNLGQYIVTGIIPESLNALDTAETISFNANSLRGTVPSFFTRFDKLVTLDLGNNLLTGTIPSDWSGCKIMESLTLGKNKITGTVPDSIYDLLKLTTLDLGSMSLQGTISAKLNQLSGLDTLVLSENNFTGVFPEANLLKLTSIDISNNAFSGKVPSFLGEINVTTLTISNNQFSGALPAKISSMKSLRYLDISSNKFYGVVPIPGPLTRFYIASYNSFSSLSTSMAANSPYLSLVDFSHNNLTGPYTDFSSRLPTPTNAQLQDGMCLQYIDFSFNSITGGSFSTFQLSVNRWPLLVSISFRGNQIHNNLQFMYATTNTYLRTVDVADNPLMGTLPVEFAALPSLQNIILTNTSLKYLTSYLPPLFTTNNAISTYFEELNLYCPQITTQYGAVVTLDNEYNNYELCQCEPGYRRKITKNSINPSINFQCIDCPDGLNCPGRANDTIYTFSPKFYPSPSAEDPMALLKCANCMNKESTNFTCALHHSGRLCSKCDDGYFWSGSSCNMCIPLGSALLVLSILLLVAALIGFAAYSLFLRGILCVPVTRNPLTSSTKIRSHLHTMQAFEDENIIDTKMKSTAAVSIAINYYQTVSALSQYFSLPSSVISLLSISKILSSATGAGVGLACISHQLNEYDKIYTAVLLEPIVIMAIILVFFVLGRGFVMATRNTPNILKEWDITCLTILLFGINFLFFPISSTVINAFRCDEDPVTGISYNSAYPFAKCDFTPIGTRILVLVFYVGGILAIFSSLVIAYNRSPHGSLWHQLIGKTFGFFFLHYRKKYNFFAILVLFRRFILSLLISLIPVNTVLSFGLVSTVLVVSISMNHIVQPFKSLRDNHLETLTILAALFAYTLAFTLSISSLDYGSVPIVVFYFCVNVGVVVWCIGEFLSGQVPRLKEILLFLRARAMRARSTRGVRIGVVSVTQRSMQSSSSMDSSSTESWSENP